jgi:putative endonuclease
MEEAFVYMVTNDRGNVLYTGCTQNLKERVYFHKKGMISGFTKKYNVSRLVYFERHADMGSARRRERELKGKNRAKKDLLIKSINPSFTELNP